MQFRPTKWEVRTGVAIVVGYLGAMPWLPFPMSLLGAVACGGIVWAIIDAHRLADHIDEMDRKWEQVVEDVFDGEDPTK